jgi:hypothetical protein
MCDFRGSQSGAITACLAVDTPTPASASSWGSIKAIYR